MEELPIGREAGAGESWKDSDGKEEGGWESRRETWETWET